MQSSLEDRSTNDTTVYDNSLNFIEQGEKEEQLPLQDLEPKIVTYSEAPEFMRDNEFIIRGYRINFNSAKKIVKSLFLLHNETVNVWTHLLGSIFVLVLFLYTALFIKKRYFDVDGMQEKFDYIKQEIQHLKTPIVETFHYFDDLTEKSTNYINDYISVISNKTTDYFHTFDNKLSEYSQYISSKVNCLECLGEIAEEVKNFTEQFLTIDIAKLRDLLLNETSHVINFPKIRDIFETTNNHFVRFRNRIIDDLESKEMGWIDMYTSSKENNNRAVRRWPLFVFLFGAVSCLSMSAFFHLCFVYSKDFSEFIARLDYAGISLLIAGSCFPIYYYSFFCMDFLRTFYLALISTLCLSIFLFSLTKSFTLPSNRKLRGGLFLLAGISTAVPIIHLCFLTGNPGMLENADYLSYALGGVAYICGAMIYILRVPEKHCPGTFCIWGSSHQIWHCLVITGMIFHYIGSVKNYHERMNHPECPRY